MAPINRTVEIRGRAYATTGNVHTTLNINGTQYFSGHVPTEITANVPTVVTELSADRITDILGTFSLSSTVTGNVNLQIETTGGTLVFHYLSMNYTWPEGYIDPDTGKFVVTTPEAYAFFDSNINDNVGLYDGKTNIQLNGTPAVENVNYGDRGGPDNADLTLMGDAPIVITSGSTMTCTYGITVNNFPAGT